jgi:glycosyltransferase involved in cell wall biosynthesis
MQNKKPKVAIIGTNGLPGKYGGWDQLLNHLTLNLREKYNFIVYTSYFDAEKGLKEFNGAKLKIIRLKANGMQSVLYDIVSLIHAAFKYDVLLVLGTSGCIFLPIIRLFRKKIILNPDGCEWKRGKWSKPVQAFLKLSEKFGIRFSDFVVADNSIIQEYIKNTYHKTSELIEYGGDQATFIPMSDETRRKYSLEINNYAFKVCRIEPENNIHIILEAFKNTNMDLVIVGNWNFSNYGKELRSKYRNYKNLKLLDPIYEQTSLNEIRSNCGLYIHGHSVGGTNPSLVEAMNIGLCPIVFNVNYNIETTENQAIYFNSANDLVKIVTDYQNKKIDTSIYKEKMKEIAKRRYTWEIITDKYSNVFLKEKNANTYNRD